jgi:hypothetical protein
MMSVRQPVWLITGIPDSFIFLFMVNPVNLTLQNYPNVSYFLDSVDFFTVYGNLRNFIPKFIETDNKIILKYLLNFRDIIRPISYKEFHTNNFFNTPKNYVLFMKGNHYIC